MDRNEQEKSIICLMGPTGVGKSRLALEIAAHMDVEIICVDSVTVYRGLDIGSAKPSRSDRADVEHHLLDIRDPATPYSVAEFLVDVHQHIDAIISRGKIPLLVGGSMLYFHVLQHGISQLPAADQKIRENITQRIAVLGNQAVWEQLYDVDRQAAETIAPGDTQRLSRALEINSITGKTLSEHFSRGRTTQGGVLKAYNIHLYAHERAYLNKLLANRLDRMLSLGFVEEVEKLYQRGDLHSDLPAIKAVGYRQIWNYIAGDYDYGSMKQRVVVSSRQFAKRQMTWLRNMEANQIILTDNMQDMHELYACIQKYFCENIDKC